MRRFGCQAENDRFRVGCTGGTVYVYDAGGTELALFRGDIDHITKVFLSPAGNVCAAKSTTGMLAAYDLDGLKLIRKFRCARAARGGQDGGAAFSPEGDVFYNLETRNDMCSSVAVYDGRTFEERQAYLDEERFQATDLVYSPSLSCLLILGYFRGEAEDNRYVAAKFDGRVYDEAEISDAEFFQCSMRQSVADAGFTEECAESLLGYSPESTVDTASPAEGAGKLLSTTSEELSSMTLEELRAWQEAVARMLEKRRKRARAELEALKKEAANSSPLEILYRKKREEAQNGGCENAGISV